MNISRVLTTARPQCGGILLQLVRLHTQQQVREVLDHCILRVIHRAGMSCHIVPVERGNKRRSKAGS